MKSHLLHAHLTAQFKGVSPEKIYETYTSAEEHERATGQPASIDAREGGEFSAYDGYLTGKFINLIPGRLIVQYWRSGHFKDTDPDSILTIAFRKNEFGAAEMELLLTHYPDHLDYNDNTAWNNFYVEPFRAYLNGKPEPPPFNLGP